MPYWPVDVGDTKSGDGRNPDPLSVTDLPSPLEPFAEFLGNAAVEESTGEGGCGPGEAYALDFEPTPFDHPVFIMFSSGTTGLPKCMVHGAGGKYGICVALRLFASDVV